MNYVIVTFMTVFGAVSLLSGVRMVVRTERALDQFDVLAKSVTALNFMRVDFGGFLIVSGLLRLLAVWHATLWAWPLLLVMSVAALIRVLSFTMDGLSRIAVFALFIELLTIGFAGVLLTTPEGLA